MEKQVRSMWFYCILLVAVAIVLIVISVLSDSKISPSVTSAEQEEIAFNKTVQENLTTLMEERNQMESQLQLKEQELSEVTQANQQLAAENHATGLLMRAKALYDKREYARAAEVLENIDTAMLTEDALSLYTSMKNNL